MKPTLLVVKQNHKKMKQKTILQCAALKVFVFKQFIWNVAGHQNFDAALWHRVDRCGREGSIPII
jgi:hypothetical protein